VAAGKRPKRIPPTVRRAVRERDHGYCRWCGDPRNGQLHHILYRSQGGVDEEWNLILLCNRCHAIAHSNKNIYQPLLQGTLWMEYFNGVHLTVAQFSRWLT
jgi:5-methylcytosine-specific restriction endonuclease McrA